MLLAHASVTYEDERLDGEQFAPRKAAGEFNNGQLPVWVQNGIMMNESLSILRYVGKQYGYYPSDPQERWATDAIVDFVNDYLVKLVEIVFFEKRLDESG